MAMPRSCLLAALLCLAVLFFQPRKLAGQAMPSPEIQRRIDNVCACLTTLAVEMDDAHACQTP
jgi:hypothetical protein